MSIIFNLIRFVFKVFFNTIFALFGAFSFDESEEDRERRIKNDVYMEKPR